MKGSGGNDPLNPQKGEYFKITFNKVLIECVFISTQVNVVCSLFSFSWISVCIRVISSIRICLNTCLYKNILSVQFLHNGFLMPASSLSSNDLPRLFIALFCLRINTFTQVQKMIYVCAHFFELEILYCCDSIISRILVIVSSCCLSCSCVYLFFRPNLPHGSSHPSYVHIYAYNGSSRAIPVMYIRPQSWIMCSWGQPHAM